MNILADWWKTDYLQELSSNSWKNNSALFPRLKIFIMNSWYCKHKKNTSWINIAIKYIKLFFSYIKDVWWPFKGLMGITYLRCLPSLPCEELFVAALYRRVCSAQKSAF